MLRRSFIGSLIAPLLVGRFCLASQKPEWQLELDKQARRSYDHAITVLGFIPKFISVTTMNGGSENLVVIFEKKNSGGCGVWKGVDNNMNKIPITKKDCSYLISHFQDKYGLTYSTDF